MNHRTAIIILSVIVLAAVTIPVLQNFSGDPIDSFPLSYYPMFTKDRGETVNMIMIVGFNHDGDETFIPISFAGSGGFHQIRKQMNRTYERGELSDMCQNVAARIAKNTEFANIERVEFIRGTFNIQEYFSGNKRPISEKVLARKNVQRDS